MMLTAERQTSMTEAALASQVDQSGSWPLWSFLRAGIVMGSLNYYLNAADFRRSVTLGLVQSSHYYLCLSEILMKARNRTYAAGAVKVGIRVYISSLKIDRFIKQGYTTIQERN